MGCVARGLIQQSRGGGEEWLLGPGPTLQTLHDDARTFEINVAPRQERDFSHPESVVIDQREERAVAETPNRGEECSDFELCEVAGQPLTGPEDAGQRWDEVRK